MKHVLRAIRVNVWADVRPNFTGAGLFGLLFGPAVLLGVGFWISKQQDHGGYGTVFVNVFFASLAVGLASFVALQLIGEFQSERLNGGLLRARTLPHGPLTWAISKTISSLVITLVIQAITFGVGIFAISSVTVKMSDLLLLLPLVVLATFACAPIGFILGALNRGMFTQMLSFLVAMGLIATSGVFFPLSSLPRWVQIIQMGLPFYWCSHLSRYLLLGADNAAAEVGEAFHPFMALAILGVWVVGGYAISTLVARRAFQRETLSALTSFQQRFKSQVGM